MNIGVTSQGLKWLGREFNYSSLCIVEVKNEWIYTSPHSFYPLDVSRETFSLSVGILGYIIWGSSLIVRSEVFAMVTVRIFLGCDTCFLVEVNRHFGGTCSSSSVYICPDVGGTKQHDTVTAPLPFWLSLVQNIFLVLTVLFFLALPSPSVRRLEVYLNIGYNYPATYPTTGPLLTSNRTCQAGRTFLIPQKRISSPRTDHFT